MHLDVTLDLSEIRAARTRVAAALGDVVVGAVSRACEEGAAEAIRVHRYKDRTGKLTGSIRAELLSVSVHHSGEVTATGRIVAGASYASFVENGTRPHVIRPKLGSAVEGPLLPGQSRQRGKKKALDREGRTFLRWEGSDGQVHFAREVHHPGGRPYPFMGPGYLKAERVLEAETAAGIARVCAEENAR